MLEYNKKVLSEASQNGRAAMMQAEVSPEVVVTANLLRVMVIIAETLDQIVIALEKQNERT